MRRKANGPVLGIVGAEAAKFTPQWQIYAKYQIHEAFIRHQPSLIVSGRCPLGGVDIWAIEEARKAGIRTREFPPGHNSWEYFKARNIQIAESDIVLCITVRYYHNDYKGRRFKLCYHCKTDDHVKSGGCWTMHYARRLGHESELVIVGEPDGARYRRWSSR